ncbi:hypothetical protein KFL_007230040 [Klebsormidium nitens]|uniref:Uncharacterized protein n=1 Tax=Klebsormidium nitens TaxID=105231 RepID=A0A1Y1ILP4_KLENI|nr:hypothetical protein KFL_007230040 [Klebsormidium nitens]|eukprot:GAQ91072.1 hypothetical protein KFL_007230040 [Klebsormidium nitens]
MAHKPGAQVKRRFEVHLPVSQKRHRPNEAEEPQQNPLQAWLTKRKTAPGLEAILSEARKENPVVVGKNRVNEELDAGPSSRTLQRPPPVSVAAQSSRTLPITASLRQTSEFSAKNGRGNGEGGGLTQEAGKGLQRQTVEGQTNGGMRGSHVQNDGALRKSEGDDTQAGTAKKKKRRKRASVVCKAVTTLVSGQPKASVSKLKTGSPVGGKKKPPLLGGCKGGTVGKNGGQMGEPAVKPIVNPKPPQVGKSTKPVAPRDTNRLSRDRANGGTGSSYAIGGPADVSTRSAPEAAERPLPYETRGPREGKAPQPLVNHSVNQGLGNGLTGGGNAQPGVAAPQKAPSKSGWDVPGPLPGMGFVPNPPQGPWNSEMPGAFHTGFQPGFPPDVPRENAFTDGPGPVGEYGVNWPGQAGHRSMQARECQQLWETLQRSMQTWHSVLLQRDTDAAQRSAHLRQQTAASKLAQETAAEQLAVARKLKHAAEEICEAAVEERRSAAAALREARDERAAIERAKQELETRREELATEAMELDQKRRLCEEALARLAETEKATARERHAAATTAPTSSLRPSPFPVEHPTHPAASPAEASPLFEAQSLADVTGRPADVSSRGADVSGAAEADYSRGRRPFLGVVSNLMQEREESGSPSPLGLYRGFTGLSAVKIEDEDILQERGGAEAGTQWGGDDERALRGTVDDGSAARSVGEVVRGVGLGAKSEPPKPEGDGLADMSMSDEDMPLSFRSALRKDGIVVQRGTGSALGLDRGTDTKEGFRQTGQFWGHSGEQREGEWINGERERGGRERQQEAAQIVSDVKAELAAGRRSEPESVLRGVGVLSNREPNSNHNTGNPDFPGLGPLGRYPNPRPSISHPTAKDLSNSARESAQTGKQLEAGKKKKRTAVEVLRKDAPELLESLSKAGMLDDMKLYGDDFDGDEEAAGSASFRALQAVLNKIYDGSASRNGASWTSSGNLGAAHLPKYSMGALKVLTDEAKRLRRGGRPVEWGWCHKLHAFLFVFEEQNRFVLEWPQYGNATYFFNLEAGDVQFQLQRLIAVMAIGTVTKNDIVDDRPLERIRGIPPDELRVLEEFGRKPETGLGSFLNFANRVVHDYKDECTLEQWQTRIREELHRGRNTGQIEKSPRPLPWAGLLGEVAPLALETAAPVTREELLVVKAEQNEELGNAMRT